MSSTFHLYPQSSFSHLPPLITETISVKYEDGTTSKFPLNSTVEKILEPALPKEEHPEVVGAYVNSQIQGLSEVVDVNVETIKPIYINTDRGCDIYRRTLTFLCGMAANMLFPNHHFTIGHSLGSAYYFQLENEKESEITEQNLKALDEKMRELVQKDLPIRIKVISWFDAVHHLETAGIPEALCLVKTRNTPRIPIVECDGFFHPSQGAYLDRTSKLRHFLLLKYGSPNGFLVQFPRSRTPDILPPFEDQPKLFETFQQTQAWEKKCGVVCVGDVNNIVRDRNTQHLRDFVVLCEAVHDRILVETAAAATSNPKTKIILIAGPSSSGKTTFARKLCVHLRVLGKTPICISLDDFYHNRDKTPIDPETGDYDFEALEALDLQLINDTFLGLLAGKAMPMPVFDFVAQKRKWPGHTLQMKDDTIFVVEGIHGLNDRLTEMIPRENKFKIFISALTRLNLDEHHRVPTTDNRLLRRMVRDFQFRGTSAEETIQRWPSVRKGEVRNIFPFQNTADIIFNSSVEYEINALKTIAEPLLRNIVPDSPHYSEAQRLLNFLNNFDAMLPDCIPPTALVREFLGGSSFQS